jgi:formate-dependent nitrite reductase membrane component NrfD
MVMERQTSWGGLAALYMFLSGTGAGIYTAGFILGLISNLRWLAVTAITLGPILVIAGLLCLLLEVGKPLRSYRFLEGLSTSWMSRGGLIQIVFVILGLGYVLPGFWLPEWLSSGGGITLGSIALVLAVAVATYHGVALAEFKAIPLWSSSVLPLLSFFTALCAGLGLLLLISPAYIGIYAGREVMQAVGILGIAGIALIVGKLISLWSLMNIRSSAISTESTSRLRMPIIASAICLFLALLLLIGLVFGGVTYFIWASPISGVLLLASGFITRYSILKRGYYVPLRAPVESTTEPIRY